VTYRMFAAYWPEQTSETQAIADALNATPKVVFSSTLESAPWGSWEAARVVSGSAAEEVRRLKAEPGKDMVVWGSLALSDSLMREGLVDEYRLQVCPVVLGRGKRLFEDGLATQWLTRLETNTYDEMVAVRYASRSSSILCHPDGEQSSVEVLTDVVVVASPEDSIPKVGACRKTHRSRVRKPRVDRATHRKHEPV
jgi:dihydrofolate reductase